MVSPLEKEVISGLTAGSLTTLIVHPLDLFKVRLQLLITAQGKNGYRSVWNEIRKSDSTLVRELYRGLNVNFVGNTVAWGLYFTTYRIAKDYLIETNSQIKNDKGLTSWMYLVAGVSSGVFTTVLTNPFWVVKTRMMSKTNSKLTSTKILKDLIKKDGFRGLWKGLLPATFGVSQGALHFTCYDTLKNKLILRDRAHDDKISNLETITVTSISKMISTAAVYPFQLLKSNLQSFQASEENFKLLSLSKLIYQKNGIVGFYKGLSANLLRSVPSTCITFCIYENFKNILT
ncbi:flavin adenine dinucleotide transporter FLX1 [Nakaseomyces bracarensis]|uniref:flavin adenine dinucleotide transporter FLX1 n=1 Tax=Nakaseomyces bracarensis TaxID=273131 RepID=UPI00387120BE